MGSSIQAAPGDTICAVATPPGPGAIGVVRLSGPRALELGLAMGGRARLEPRRLTLCTLRDPRDGKHLDLAMVCAMPGPASYTGEDMVEFHAHGGELNLARLVETLLALGARPADPGEFSRRAFLAGKLDLTQAEAISEVIAARSERALDNAQALLRGHLGRKVRALSDAVVGICAELEARVDFAPDLQEEDDFRPSDGDLMARHEAVERSLRSLLESYRSGRHLGGARVVLHGPVNAGKSSLFNALLHAERAVVSSEPGTTRDYIEAQVSWEGFALTLVDTAGVRQGPMPGEVERRGQGLAARVLAESPLGLWVVDLSAGCLPPPPPAQGGPPRWLVVANKSDLPRGGWADEVVRAGELGGLPLVVTSARTGSGLSELMEAVATALGMDPEGGETVQVTRTRHHAALTRALQALVEARQALDAGFPPEVVLEHHRQVLSHLGAVTGERFTEGILDRIFSTFCIGK